MTHSQSKDWERQTICDNTIKATHSSNIILE